MKKLGEHVIRLMLHKVTEGLIPLDTWMIKAQQDSKKTHSHTFSGTTGALRVYLRGVHGSFISLLLS